MQRREKRREEGRKGKIVEEEKKNRREEEEEVEGKGRETEIRYIDVQRMKIQASELTCRPPLALAAVPLLYKQPEICSPG